MTRINNGSILNMRSQEAFLDFLKLCGTVKGVDVSRVDSTARATIFYLKSKKQIREKIRLDRELEQYWYQSIEGGSPDWSVYNSDDYLGELWACWIVYSRQYITNLIREGIFANIGKVKRIVDLGCGIGYTTAALKEIYPDAEVIGTNLDDTTQTDLARKIGRHYGFQVIPDIYKIKGSVDLIFASEYFEHIPEPIQHLNEILFMLEPRALLIANTFNSRAIGHFNHYRVNGAFLDGRITSRRFNKELREKGYTKIKTKLWNNRPTCWITNQF